MGDCRRFDRDADQYHAAQKLRRRKAVLFSCTVEVTARFPKAGITALDRALTALGVSIVLARRWGIAGVLTGTLISTMSMPFWIEPLGLFRYGLKQAPGEYVGCDRV